MNIETTIQKMRTGVAFVLHIKFSGDEWKEIKSRARGYHCSERALLTKHAHDALDNWLNEQPSPFDEEPT